MKHDYTGFCCDFPPDEWNIHTRPTDQQTSRTNITEALDWDRITEAVARTMIDSDTYAANEVIAAEYAALAAEPSEPAGFDLRSNDVRPPRSDAVTAPDEPSGAERIAVERQRQIEVEGYDPLNDLYDHDATDLEQAALTYLGGDPDRWPWANSPKFGPTRVRELEKAGALIAAAIDHHLGAAVATSASEDERYYESRAQAAFTGTFSESSPAYPDEPNAETPDTAAGKALVEWAQNAFPEQIDIWRDHAIAIEREARAAHLNPADSGSSASGSTDSQSPGVPLLDVERLSRALHSARLGCWETDELAWGCLHQYAEHNIPNPGDHWTGTLHDRQADDIAAAYAAETQPNEGSASPEQGR